MTELLDIYDENLTHLGVKPRSEVHRDGDWHKVFHCWVIYRDDEGQDWIVLQKRAPDKDTFPNYLDISAAGHYGAGETIQEAMRELEEELGLSPKFEDLIPLGTRVGVAKYEALIDRQFADVFLYVCHQALADYRYQKEEISGLIALNVEQGMQLFAGQIDSLNVPAVGYENDTTVVTMEDFIPVVDNYMEKIFLLTTRCLDGETQLFI
ncbi:MAG: NUDIX domain-containing protein [Phototrophicaceae bacterium]